MSKKDEIYQGQRTPLESFRFDQDVVGVFPDMIDRSVPGYSLIVPMIGQLARRYARPGTEIHDLGCSLGAATLSIRRNLPDQDVKIIATDNSAAMVEKFARILDKEPAGPQVDVILGDIRDTELNNASVVVLNFTLQFVAVKERPALLKKIARGLVSGGVLLISEKIRFSDEMEQANQTDWHHDFKRLRGYSELEIARKRAALENVLLPETEKEHINRLRQAGFRRVTRWFQCFGFCSFLAEK